MAVAGIVEVAAGIAADLAVDCIFDSHRTADCDEGPEAEHLAVERY